MVLKNSLEKVISKDCIIEVFGLGYVGFPLSIRLAMSGFKVVGIDTDSNQIENLRNKNLQGSQLHLKEAFVKSLDNGNFTPTANPATSELPKIGLICVPTPIPNQTTDSNVFVNLTTEKFLKTSKPGDVIILESSVMPGTTREISKKIESEGFKVGDDYGLCFCPERIDPLNKKWNLENIPRVIFCSDDITFKIAQKIYHHVNNSNLFRVSSPEVAEVVKSFENAFRLVNISLVNEIAILCEKLKIDVNEVIKAASTKPFGFMPFYSSAGAGGHCIPKDPRFLLDSAKKFGINFSTIENAISINSAVPKHIANSIEKTLGELKLEKSVLVSGLSYKPDIEDMRDSPGFKILKEFKLKGFSIAVHDPFFKEELREKYLIENNCKDIDFDVQSLDDNTLKNFSCLCVVQNHSKTKFRIDEIYRNSLVPLIYDCQNKIHKIPDSKTLLRTLGT